MGRRIESSIYRIAAELSRVGRVREAVRHSVPLAMADLQHTLSSIELGRVLQVLTSLLEDLLAVYVCSALLGGAVGGAIGAFAAAGVGAVPGAVGGASLGMSLATWVLGWLGLGLMAKEIADSLPAAFKEYAEGALEAWGPPNQPAYASHHEPFAPRGNVGLAAMRMARGHRLLMLALLSGIMMYVSRGAASRLELLSKIRSSQRLGPAVADWIEANERKLMEHPALRSRTSGAQGGGAGAESGAASGESFEQGARGEKRVEPVNSRQGHRGTGPTVLQVRATAEVNQGMVQGGNLPAWGGATVTTEVVPAGTRFNMAVSEGQAQALMAGKPAFGSWATPDAIPSQAFARSDLAILPEFKPDVSFVAQVETTASQTVNRGLVGPLGDYAGGASQVEFVGGRNLKLVGQPQPLPTGPQ